MRKTAALLALALGIMAAPAAAQTTPATASDRLGWDQPAATLAEAAGYTYLLKIDNAANPVVIAPASVTCTGTASPFVCSIAFPAATPGTPHTAQIAARIVYTIDGKPFNADSAYSSAFTFQLVVIPGTPVNVRRLPGSGDE